MNNRTFAILAACLAVVLHSSIAATIPAGTSLVVQTNETISSDEPAGKIFAAQLARDVTVDGRVLLRAGAQVTGRVDAPRRQSFTPLLLNVTQVAINGRMVPIKTAGPFPAKDILFKTTRGVSVGRGGFFQLPTGKILQFKLGQPVNLTGKTAGR